MRLIGAVAALALGCLPGTAEESPPSRPVRIIQPAPLPPAPQPMPDAPGKAVAEKPAEAKPPAAKPAAPVAQKGPEAPPAAPQPAASPPAQPAAPQPAAPATQKAPDALPGGASSLSETFQDWLVTCLIADGRRQCSLSHQQTNSQTGQRVIAMEVTSTGDKAEGILLMPFGLALEQGVTVQFDDQAPAPPLKFKTCLPVGCIVPVSFEGKTMAGVKLASALKVKATAAEGAPLTFALSLKGFAPGLDRLAVLSK